MVMGRTCYPNHCVHWYMSELTSRIVADSGIPSDRHHMGKIVLQSLRDAQDYEFQIDGATGERESSGSVLARSVRCARALTRSGLRAGDVIALMAPNHVHLAIPFYAALYLGIAVACVDRTFGIKELKKSFAKTQPKIVFCQNEKATGVKLVLKELSLDCQIVTFDKGENLYFGELLGNYGNDIEIEDFKPTDFDPEKTLAILIPTTGTTGGLKWASLSHRNLAVTGPYLLWERHTNLASPSRMCLTMSQIQWITEIIYLISTPIFKTPLIMTSNDSMPMDHVVELIRTHKPTFTILSPTQAASIMKHENCDLTCFELIWVGGSVVSEDIINKLKIRAPNAHVCNVYGMTETGGLVFCSDITIPLGSSGKLVGFLEAQIVETDTHKEILEPYAKGELWVKGPAVFVGYYNDPEDTKETMTEDGWFKTGDMFYRDENWNYFFVDRIKLMLYYKKYQITPAELEAGIREHPRVFDVAISSIPDFLWGDLPIACVVLKEGNKTIEQEIKDLVKESLFDSKQLPGGVVFMQRLPLTSSATLDRWKLKEMVQRMDKEAILIS